MITLGQMKQLVRQRADQENSHFISDTELTGYINRSYLALYDLLVTAYQDFFTAGPFEIITSSQDSSYALPDDFYKLLGVDLDLNGQMRSLRPFNFSERNKAQGVFAGSGMTRYRVFGSNLLITPAPASGLKLHVWYVPQASPLTDDALSSVSGALEQYADYMIVDSAIKCLVKEESDTSQLMQEKAEILKRIQDSASDRDAGSPSTVSDVTPRHEAFDLW